MPPQDSFSWLHATFFFAIDFCFLLHGLLSNPFTQGLQVTAFYDPSLLSYDLVLKVMHGPFEANVHSCGSFQLLFDIHDKCSYP